MARQSDTTKLPPYDVASEESILGSLLIDDAAIWDVMDVLRAEDFYRAQNGLVYAAMRRLADKGSPIDQVTVASELGDKLAEVGGPGYLSHLVLTTPTSVHARYYAQNVRRLADMRRLIDTAGRVAALGYDANGNSADVLDRAQRMLLEIGGSTSDRLITPRQWAEAIMERHGEVTNPVQRDRYMTGLVDLDNLLGGLYPGELMVLGGGTGMGKSTLAYQVADHLASNQSVTVLYVSNEMTMAQIAERDMSIAAGIPIGDIRAGNITEAQERRIMEHCAIINERSLYAMQSADFTTTSIRAQVERMKQSVGCHLVVVDYLGLLRDRVQGANEYARVTEISHRLKSLATGCNVAVLAVSQLNRHWDQRPFENKRPKLSDLRDSGNLEQDADAVVFVWRWDMVYGEDEWDEMRGRNPLLGQYPRGQAELLVAKVRQGGKMGLVKTVWNGRYYACMTRG